MIINEAWSSQSAAGGLKQPREGDKQPKKTAGRLPGRAAWTQEGEGNHNPREQEAARRPGHNDQGEPSVYQTLYSVVSSVLYAKKLNLKKEEYDKEITSAPLVSVS